MYTPTGSGKTYCWALHALPQPNTCTVVISPLLALFMDLKARCRASGLTLTRFTSDLSAQHDVNLNVLLVNVEQAGSAHFQRVMATLAQQHRLAWIVFDEVHIVLDSQSYRSTLQESLLGTKICCSWDADVGHNASTCRINFIQRVQVRRSTLRHSGTHDSSRDRIRNYGM